MQENADLIKEFKKLQNLNKELVQEIKQFRSLGRHTPDVDMCMEGNLRLARRAKQDIFTCWNIFRFKWQRAHPRMLQGMEDISEEYEKYCTRESKAWKYPDSKHIRDTDCHLFYKREEIEGSIRSSLDTLAELRYIAQEYRRRYGEHEHLLSNRSFKWITFILGAVSGWAVGTVATAVSHIIRQL